MPWFLVGDSFPTHPKVLPTSLAARGLWVTVGSWSSAHLTDGFVRDQELASLGGTPELASELVTAGLWRRVRSGYKFRPGVTHRIPTQEGVDNRRRMDAERQNRWRKKQRSVVSNASTDASVDRPSSPNHKPPHPAADAAGTPAGPCPTHGNQPHRNCRGCGTNPRGKPPPPPALRHPSARPAAQAIAEAQPTETP